MSDANSAFSYAQHIVQLLNQVRRAGYSAADVALISRAYDFLLCLYSGQYRSNRIPAICHFVGTASILARHNANVPVVIAGMLHSVYCTGDFGDGKGGISESKRQRVLQVVGADIEAYIAGFISRDWKDEQLFPSLLAQIDSLGEADRAVLFIFVADFLQNFLDLAVAYTGDWWEHTYSPATRNTVVNIGVKLGYPDLAAELAQVLQENELAAIPPELRPVNDRRLLIAPASYTRRRSLVLRQRVSEGLKARLPGFHQWLKVRWQERQPIPG